MRYITYNLMIAFFAMLSIVSCSDSERNVPEPPTAPPIGMGVVSGTVEFWSGDFMPVVSEDGPTGSIEKVSRRLYLFERARLDYDVTPAEDGYPTFYESVNTQLIASSESNDDGWFRMIAPPGEYTLVVEENGWLYANLFDGDGAIFPVEVIADDELNVVFQITYMATF